MTTLQDEITAVRNETDSVNADWVTDAEITRYINLGRQACYNLVIKADLDYFLSNAQFSVTGSSSVPQGVTTITVPANCQKVRGVDVSLGGQWKTVNRFNFNQRNLRTVFGGYPGQYPLVNVYYRYAGNLVYLAPDNAATGLYRLWFWPYLPPLVNTTDPEDPTFDQTGWWEYSVLYAAIKVLDKEESDSAPQRASLEALKEEIMKVAADRDEGEPTTLDPSRGEAWNPLLGAFGSYGAR